MPKFIKKSKKEHAMLKMITGMLAIASGGEAFAAQLKTAAAATKSSAVVETKDAASDAENTLIVKLKDGDVKIVLRPDLAPKHVERIKTLTRRGFYNGVKFHRVIEGFMAQTGDPTGTGAGGSDLPNVPAEFNAAKHVRGTVSMARANDPNSANSQFFICFADSPFLDNQYTVFGSVVSGMEAVDKIKKGDSNDNGSVKDPDTIISMQVLADVQTASH